MAVGQMRQIEFLADEEGDWAFHCHKSHHTMNAMGHDVPTMIGVDHRGVAKQITSLIPDYMVMGERGMADMGEMEMPLPDNTLPMMTGKGPYGAVEMGGMFTVLKVRRDQKPGDYRIPAGTSSRPARRPTSGRGPSRSRRASSPRAGNRCRPPRSRRRRIAGAQTDRPFRPLIDTQKRRINPVNRICRQFRAVPRR